ncbi:MAG: acetoacetate--CoA ligase [Smithellaceae bacterium]|nr:acetoacetate--CoA ligase [Smithellaceae bacterium]
MAKLLWSPSEVRIKSSNMFRFMTFVNERRQTDFHDYEELFRWSVDNIPDLWAAVWDFVGIKAQRGFDRVVEDLDKLPGAKWFPGARLNFAENLLRYRDDRIALIFRGEDQAARKMTYAELYREVAQVADSLKSMGIKPGDRVAGFLPNMPEAVVAMLAATSLGAVWSSCSPDFGLKGVLDRFGQIKPRVLFVGNGYFFKGKSLDSLARVAEIVAELPSVERVVVAPYTEKAPDIHSVPRAVMYDAFKSSREELTITFEQLPFEHPLYIMFTSGTTGLPKCMVQSAGGILIHHLKELVIHSSLSREDTIFYFTTCGWMMWNWLVSSLAVGASVVLYDGNPFHPHPGALWQMAEEEKITVFGTSAGYINALMNEGIKPRERYDLSKLKAILSTGSPLSVEGFDFVYRHVKADVQLASIAGGSDINGCFTLGNPMGAVYAGEIQCRALGMKVAAFDESGSPVINQQGELVCQAPSPSMPIYFWDDPEGKKYHAAYFDVYPGVWRHGDFILINERGGVVIYGRSDATLNPGGVRIGTAEIYRLVEAMEEIGDSIVIGQNWKNDVRVVLFVKMAPGAVLTDEIRNRIRQSIRSGASPRHVPAKIVAVADIPYTLNMKKVELSVKRVVEGQPVTNRDALKNPEALEYYADLKELQED